MSIIVGSARIDERGKLSGGNAGDQKQTSSSNDRKGEVSMQDFYVHSKGWYILRPKKESHANQIANNMKVACNNPNLGYDQNQRLGVVQYGVNSKTKTECDCSSLVRTCVKEATGKDPGNFTTYNEADMLERSGLFEKRKSYTSGTALYAGDVLVTKTQGHTVIVVEGEKRSSGSSDSLSVPSDSPNLKLGSSGSEVKKLQKCLNKIMKSGLAVDGEFGSATKKAIMEFQKKYKLTIDGIYGPKCKKKMKSLL